LRAERANLEVVLPWLSCLCPFAPISHMDWVRCFVRAWHRWRWKRYCKRRKNAMSASNCVWMNSRFCSSMPKTRPQACDPTSFFFHRPDYNFSE
jgi:hypothetical protein